MKFVAVGDNCIDWYYRQNEAHVGGCSVNVSVYISQMGAESAYLGAVGRDENGVLVKQKLESFGVNTDHLHLLDGKTAVTKIELIENDRCFRGYDEGVLAEKYVTEEDLTFIRSCDYMHTSVYGNCQELLQKVENDVVIAYDFAYKLEHETIPEVLKHIHYGFFSYEADDAFIRQYLRECWSKGSSHLQLLVATLGGKGSLSYDGREFYRHTIVPVKPVDTMGAGDSFISGFLVTRAKGMDYVACMAAGSEKARETILRKGAFGA